VKNRDEGRCSVIKVQHWLALNAFILYWLALNDFIDNSIKKRRKFPLTRVISFS